MGIIRGFGRLLVPTPAMRVRDLVAWRLRTFVNLNAWHGFLDQRRFSLLEAPVAGMPVDPRAMKLLSIHAGLNGRRVE